MRSLLPSAEGEPDLDVLYAFPATSGRLVRGNFVSAVDGAIEIGGHSGPLGGTGDSRVYSLLRGLADVVLVGAGTARAEGYGPAVLDADRQQRRRAAGQLPVPPIAVVTTTGLAADSPLLDGNDESPRPIVLTTRQAAQDAPDVVRDRAEVEVCGDGTVDLAVALDALERRGLHRVLCEGGPRLLTDLLVADLLDELCLTVAPTLAGPGRARLTDGDGWTAARGLELLSVLEEDGDLLLRYRCR